MQGQILVAQLNLADLISVANLAQTLKQEARSHLQCGRHGLPADIHQAGV